MFERRLKIVLMILSLGVAGLLLRSAQLQMLQRDYWHKEAADTLKKVRYLETTRGTVYDASGHELAIDTPCVDACVDYRAISYDPDPAWLNDVITVRLQNRLGDAWTHTARKQRQVLREAEVGSVKADIEAMWETLAVVSGKSREEIEQIRQSILQRVEIRKKYIWYQNYAQALQKGGDDKSGSNIEKWLSANSDDDAKIDKFSVTVGEEIVPHVILHAISLDAQNELGRHIEKYPGLVLRPGLHRYYPYEDVACHILGRLGKVNKKDLDNDPGRGDLRRQYLPNDDIGRNGVEWLCEPALRGTLGRVTTTYDENGSENQEPAVPGQSVHLSINVELQQEIQSFFASATLHDSHGVVIERNAVLHGAAVLLDVKTNRVLSLVSYPTYDLNHFDELYEVLHDNQIDEPLRNRATESQFEPGSTMKPLVGLSAITQGAIGVNNGIECTGYLMLPNRRGNLVRYPMGRCWVASAYAKLLNGAVAHHPVPYPHQGHDGNPDGFLTYSDALERSCNVYFETVADRLGMDALSMWMSRFGIGRRTGIGIEEYPGRLPADAPVSYAGSQRTTCFLGGIGQGYVAATPLQMANVAATIARGGIWMRPKLVLPSADGTMPRLRSAATDGPDVVDLHLNPEAGRACRLGMYNVVNGRAGTGKAAHMDELAFCGKTGTAQASPFHPLILDKKGKPLLDAEGHRQYIQITPSTPDNPNPDHPWYRGTGTKDDFKLDHSWMIGFAPADDPKIAFAVLVEYGGSGGGAAADVVKASLEACIAHRLLTPNTNPPEGAPMPEASAGPGQELLTSLTPAR